MHFNKNQFSKSTKYDLKKYYKFVHKCKKCKRLFGSDNNDKALSSVICPLCLDLKNNFRKNG